VWQGQPADDFYELLQVSPRASVAVIRAAYRVLALDYHPDVNGTPEAVDTMRQLNRAYDVLSDPGRRARYDAHHTLKSGQPTPESRPRRIRRDRSSQTKQLYEPRTAVLQDAERPAVAAVLARIVLVAIVVMVVGLAVLLAWLIMSDDDPRSPGTFRPRSGVPGTSPMGLLGERSSGLCGPVRPGSWFC
jgi:hypothetical protein